jgi:TatD DNase family protein
MIETHAHIYAEQFNDDIDEVIERSQDAGITQIYMPNIDSTSIDGMLELEDRHPGYCIPMMGLHPCSVKKGFERELYLVEEWLGQRAFSAVGEIGTDLYWDKTFWPEQQEVFKVQCALASNHKLPIVIHCRESIDQTIALLEEMSEIPQGIFHCFSGNLEQAHKIIDMGFVLGIGGVSTFKNGGLEPVLKEVELNHLVLETDSPYLAPVPNRGKRNEPAYIKYVADKIAEVKGLEVEQVVQGTSETARKIFT